ncbi:hypothetical protein COCCADRAFT_98915 [Bipolaris zeicola 26-R-13]|uniref:Uncharacterized protein n=1 Tax=Cochliobolus carbonum (strain 26-R-13) TaxID=930089 RepID=W6YA94_COCC2|nr:uncharacterized protein COCCADRAFT_98915 [Bipolaris zeicola 26-R-13]EUC32364.1 hypothetical protein COCCADRAFT_98915 [Bipolaris zeicola 26-R-13]
MAAAAGAPTRLVPLHRLPGFPRPTPNDVCLHHHAAGSSSMIHASTRLENVTPAN